MNKNHYFALQIGLLILGIVILIPYLIFQFSNPELTGTQLMMEKWETFAGLMFVLIVSQVIRVMFYKKLYL